jgi:hypothetical protein
MATDYRDAADRHWEDAEHLRAGSRWANADHLYGLSAECALKAVMVGLGLELDAQDRPPPDYRVHVDKLWIQFPAFAFGRGGQTYAAPVAGAQNPFGDWSIDQRYSHRSNFGEATVLRHRDGAWIARSMLARAILDGKVP